MTIDVINSVVGGTRSAKDKAVAGYESYQNGSVESKDKFTSGDKSSLYLPKDKVNLSQEAETHLTDSKNDNLVSQDSSDKTDKQVKLDDTSFERAEKQENASSIFVAKNAVIEKKQELYEILRALNA